MVGGGVKMNELPEKIVAWIIDYEIEGEQIQGAWSDKEHMPTDWHKYEDEVEYVRVREEVVEAGYDKWVRVDVILQAVADYMRSEGCRCCENIDAHRIHEKRIAELLDVPMYDDDSGYDFFQFAKEEK